MGETLRLGNGGGGLLTKTPFPVTRYPFPILEFDTMFTKKEGGMALDYRELEVWQMSMELCEQVYGLVRHFPADERYALGDQLRRAVVSIPSNIAEGNGRDSKSDYARFLSIARGSLFEVQTQLELAERFKYVTVSDETKQHITRISKMLYSMTRKLRA